MKLFIKIIGILIAILLLVFILFTYFVMDLIKENREINNELTYEVIKDNQLFKNVVSKTEYNLNLKNNDTIYYFHFWATYCKPCIEEFEMINKNYNRIFNTKTKLLVISFEDFDKQEEWLKKSNYKMNFYQADSSSFFIKPNILYLPTTIVIQNNKIIDKRIGTTNWKDIN